MFKIGMIKTLLGRHMNPGQKKRGRDKKNVCTMFKYFNYLFFLSMNEFFYVEIMV